MRQGSGCGELLSIANISVGFKLEYPGTLVRGHEVVVSHLDQVLDMPMVVEVQRAASSRIAERGRP